MNLTIIEISYITKQFLLKTAVYIEVYFIINLTNICFFFKKIGGGLDTHTVYLFIFAALGPAMWCQEFSDTNYCVTHLCQFNSTLTLFPLERR